MPKINIMRLAGVVCALALAAVTLVSYVSRETEDIENSVLRLHIVANSDSAEDQELKLKVRDEIIERCGFLFRDCRTLEESERTARSNLGFFKYVARDVIREHGYDYPVECEVARLSFPTKRYERAENNALSLPRGEYSALNIKIGSGSGANWWCVMYPPLCFVDGVAEADDETLKNILTDSEYRLITENSPDVKIKFKIAEWLGGD